ncbi:cell wall protein [Streptomyces sp. NPDC057101]|uniref:cell wall protein n=1 Tax=Streptomyces sp. NPDC057101 TaxID=3346020 RepID=UPI00362D62B0
MYGDDEPPSHSLVASPDQQFSSDVPEVMMTLRRGLATAATMAALAPLAVLCAPAAVAAGTPPTPDASATGSAGGGAVTDSDAGVPHIGPDDADVSPSTRPDDVSVSPSTGPGDVGVSPLTEPGDIDASASPSTEPEADPAVPYCDELEQGPADVKVVASVKGLPGKIVAGSGVHPFQLVVTNTSDTDLSGVAFYAEVENYAPVKDKSLSPHVDLEFKNPENGVWTTIGDTTLAGDFFLFMEELKRNESTKIDLRLSIDSGAPADDAYSFASGAYLDRVGEQDCVAEGWAQYDFQVLGAGSGRPAPTEAERGTKKGTVERPQGNLSGLPADRHGGTGPSVPPAARLADSGAGSAVWAIGVTGGVAAVAGTTALALVRRRTQETPSG